MKRKFLLIVATLLISGAMFAQDFYWSEFNYHQWNSYQSVYGKAYLDGELQNRGDIEVASFVGDELRGRQFLIEPWPGTPAGYYIWTPCYSDVAGEVFTYKAYDHASGILYDLCDTELISTGTQGSFGSADEPVALHFTRTVEPTYGPDYPWVPSTAYNGEGMLVTAQIKINGVLVDRDTYEVGAFCGEECRGTSGTDGLIDFTDDDLGYFAMMNVMGNNGDIINFYLYDHESSSIFQGFCNTTLELENGGEVGIDIYGGDIFVLNFISGQNFYKEIAGYGNNDGGYYLIASPIGTIHPEAVANMIPDATAENDYDLFYFEQNPIDDMEWVNYKGDEYNNLGNFELEIGKGYLYANQTDVTLIFTGTPISEQTYEVPLDFYQGVQMEGWNLVGNPFAHKAYINMPFYTMNDDGSEIILSTSNSIEAMEGIFVQATQENQSVVFSTEEQSKGAALMMNVTRNRGNAIDRAIINFNNGSMLQKFMLNKNNTKLYIPMENKDYALVNANEEGEMPVNFKAAENGTYNISINTQEVDFQYLHLIDNLTGKDVNLLETPSYSFDARTTDYASRFRLVFATSNGAESDSFGFINGMGNLVIVGIEGEATLQVIDVTGRILSSETFSGSYEKHLNVAPSVYMLRLINGDNIRTQKMVVK